MSKLTPPSAFMSYSHADGDSVRLLAAALSGMGVQVWMDTKELHAGETLVESISNAIGRADLYVVVLTETSVASRWVAHELNTALSLELSHGRPHVVPVLLSRLDVPVALQSKLYINLSEVSIAQAGRLLYDALRRTRPDLASQENKIVPSTPTLELASVVLELRAETTMSYGGVENEHTKTEVEAEADDLLKRLRRSANGVLLNFVAASQMDFSSPHPRFPNGEVASYTRQRGGDLVGTSRRVAVVEVTVLKPDEKRLGELVSTKLTSLGVGRATYSFLIDPPIEGLAQRSLSKLQNSYVILGWDASDGASVELPDDLALSVSCSNESIRLSMETKYQFQFGKRAKEFSLRDFAVWLMA